MESFLNNPGFQHIGESIFMFLNRKQLQSSRLVNHSWNNFLDNPRFWFKKCIQSGLSKELHVQTEWNKLIQMLQGTNLEQNLTLCLMKMQKEDSRYFTYPLVWASIVGDLTLVQFMLEHKELFQYWINSAIRVAAIYGQTDVVKALVACTDNPNGPNNDGETPLHFAAIKGHIEVVKVLVACTDNPNALNDDGETPLHFAALTGHTDVVKILVACTDNPNAPNKDGVTTLHFAALNGHTDVVKVLVAYTDNPNAPDNTGKSPMHSAASNGHTDVVKALVACTDNPNAPSNIGVTPIQLAVYAGHTEVVKLLVECTDNAPDNNYELEIHIAASKGYTEIVNFLKFKKTHL